MHLPSYKIHNVLKVFSEQLTQNKTQEQKPTIKGINKASEGRRQAIIKKVADEILDRVTRSGIQKKDENEISSKLKKPGYEYTEEEKNEFVFNTIDDKNEKIRRTFNIRWQHFDQTARTTG
ncbi:MAG: hypothetical protein LWW97_05540 [Deltaproteobacteria bacterium]|nr:hypothetical protein [Deltaproteobacteria bacterium]